MLIGSDTLEGMSRDQKALLEVIRAGPRSGVPTPFLAMLDSPGLCDSIQRVGETIRYRTAMSDRLREIAILAAAAAYGSGYEWNYHDALAIKAGLTRSQRQSILDGTGGAFDVSESAVVRYIFVAVQQRRADQGLLGMITTSFGREIATEVTAIAGYYPILALFLSAGGLDEDLPETVV